MEAVLVYDVHCSCLNNISNTEKEGFALRLFISCSHKLAKQYPCSLWGHSYCWAATLQLRIQVSSNCFPSSPFSPPSSLKKKQSIREGGAEWTSKGLGPPRQFQSSSKCATTWDLMFLWWGSTSFVCIVHIWPSLFKYSQKACDKNCLHCNSLQYTAYTVYTAMWPVAGCTDCVTGWLDIP